MQCNSGALGGEVLAEDRAYMMSAFLFHRNPDTSQREKLNARCHVLATVASSHQDLPLLIQLLQELNFPMTNAKFWCTYDANRTRTVKSALG